MQNLVDRRRSHRRSAGPHTAGAAHEPQREQPHTVNALLTELWANAQRRF
jgi:hypothetical protein